MATLETIALFICGFVIGRFLLNVWAFRQHVKQSIEEEAIAELDKRIHIVKQEKYEEMYYWFDRDSDQFLAQGRTMDEIRNVLQQRFRDHVFVLNENQMLHGPKFDEVITYNGETR